MSSRILLPDDPRAVTAVNWRQVGPAREAGKATGAEPPPDFQLQAAQIQREGEQRIREAHAAGMREGEAAGRARAAADLQPVIDRLGRSIDELAGLRARLRSEAEADLIKLALAIARRVLRRELAIDPEALHGLVLAALEKLQGQEICRVKVHPSHAALVTECLRQIVTGATVEIILDPSREPGAIVFETARGNLDASVESQLQEIERGLADRLKRPS
jgi:flagellar assembly protein FliH